MPRYVCGGPAGAMRTSSSLMFDVPVIGGRFMTPDVLANRRATPTRAKFQSRAGPSG